MTGDMMYRGSKVEKKMQRMSMLLLPLRRQQCCYIIIQISTRKLRIILLAMTGLAALCG